MLVIVDGAFNRNYGIVALLLDCFLEPEIRIAHVAEPLLQLIEVHSDLNHNKADGIIPVYLEVLFDFILEMNKDYMIMALSTCGRVVASLIQDATFVIQIHFRRSSVNILHAS